jgi:hypothetical protein
VLELRAATRQMTMSVETLKSSFDIATGVLQLSTSVTGVGVLIIPSLRSQPIEMRRWLRRDLKRFQLKLICRHKLSLAYYALRPGSGKT